MFPNASISVISFMLCENLLNKFNEAQDQALNVLLQLLQYMIQLMYIGLYLMRPLICLHSFSVIKNGPTVDLSEEVFVDLCDIF